MFLMADVIDARLREFDALGLDQYGRPKGTTTVISNDSCNEDNNTTTNTNHEPVFPFCITNVKNMKQSAVNIVNITLTDEQFERLLDTIKSLYR